MAKHVAAIANKAQTLMLNRKRSSDLLLVTGVLNVVLEAGVATPITELQ